MTLFAVARGDRLNEGERRRRLDILAVAYAVSAAQGPRDRSVRAGERVLLISAPTSKGDFLQA